MRFGTSIFSIKRSLATLVSAIHSTWSQLSRVLADAGIAGYLGLADTSRSTTKTNWLYQVIVRLDLYFESEKGPAIGTGFFLNIPGTTQDVIVTAGHNFIRAPKPGQTQAQRVQKIVLWLQDAGGKWSTQVVMPTQCRVAQPYEQSPTQQNAIYDYGIILLDRTDSHIPRDSLGYNIALASMDLNSSSLGQGVGLNAQVGGYPGSSNFISKDPILETGNGRFTHVDKRQLHYTAATDQGMSGGPVWVDFGGEAVVVGIHNYHGEKPGEGNRGTRLEVNTIQDILRWSQADGVLLKKSIKLHSTEFEDDLKLPDGVFLQIGLSAGSPSNGVVPCYVFSGPRRDRSLTTFDIIQARTYTNSSEHRGRQRIAPQTVHYVLSHALPHKERRYLEFNTNSNTAPEQVIACTDISMACLVRFQQRPTTKAPAATGSGSLPPLFEPSGHPFRIIVAQTHEEIDNPKPSDWKLLASPHDIPPPGDQFEQERGRPGLLLRKLKLRHPQRKYEDFVLID
ncbi:hypothetical protein BDZ91DRAFT_851308 [Kalaharituber pfeilii]|nr:hypothetical protein BDZ91DRAFT_851308 [Kalaharituber pfeilii]